MFSIGVAVVTAARPAFASVETPVPAVANTLAVAPVDGPLTFASLDELRPSSHAQLPATGAASMPTPEIPLPPAVIPLAIGLAAVVRKTCKTQGKLRRRW